MKEKSQSLSKTHKTVKSYDEEIRCVTKFLVVIIVLLSQTSGKCDNKVITVIDDSEFLEVADLSVSMSDRRP